MTDDQLHRELVRMACDLASKEHEVRKLRAERDEARREVCELLYNRQGGWPKEHANERGWDCFKEDSK